MRTSLFIVLFALASSVLFAQEKQVKKVEVDFFFFSKDVDGTIEARDTGSTLNLKDFTQSQILGTADVATLDTDNFLRDGHLMWKTYFYEREYPELKFQSNQITRSSGNNYQVIADITIKGITKSAVFDASIVGITIKLEGVIYTSDFDVVIKDERKENKLEINISLTVEN